MSRLVTRALEVLVVVLMTLPVFPQTTEQQPAPKTAEEAKKPKVAEETDEPEQRPTPVTVRPQAQPQPQRSQGTQWPDPPAPR